MADVTRFAGYGSPETLAADPWLSVDDKISGLRTWRRLIVQLTPTEEERRRRAGLIGRIDEELERLEV